MMQECFSRNTIDDDGGATLTSGGCGGDGGDSDASFEEEDNLFGWLDNVDDADLHLRSESPARPAIADYISSGDSFVAVFPKPDGSRIFHIARAVHVDDTDCEEGSQLACYAIREWHTDPKYLASKQKSPPQTQPQKRVRIRLKLLPEFSKTERVPFAFVLRSVVMLHQKHATAQRLLFHNGKLWLANGGAFSPSDEGKKWRFAEPHEVHRWTVHDKSVTSKINHYDFHE